MLNNKKEFKMMYGGRELTVETGRLAKQADGAALITMDGTQVLCTVCSAREMKDGQDFFPLTVDYTERFYAAGKFLGGYLKREGRPSNQEILNSRLIDRPLRPLFPEGYMFETTVQALVISYDGKGDAEVLAGLAAAAALQVSDIPFAGPLGVCKIARLDGELVLNPTPEQQHGSDLEVVMAATRDAILMLEGECAEVSETDMLKIIKFGHDAIKQYCNLMDEVGKTAGKKKRVFESANVNAAFMTTLSATFNADARNILSIVPKQERTVATQSLIKKIAETMKADHTKFGLEEKTDFKKQAAKGVDELLYKMMRNDILTEGKRIGGRKMDQVRMIETETDVLKRVHGSALFTRGETQVMSAVTIGGAEGEQMADTMTGLSYSRFYLHYTFPPFSVGEARGYRGVGRRELGHGNLAERAIKMVLPKPEDFAYTMRVNCEVLESNGSSSMGSVCAGTMALLDAGVPLSSPVAGIAMGLIKEGSAYKILTDILGDEDHLGDMDFKVAGTEKGITAIQMDIKITGITEQIFTEALDQAKKGRLHILGEMNKTIKTHRTEFKTGVPKMYTVQIPNDKIGALIGPGGKNIKALQANFGVTMEVTEEGLVKVLGQDTDKIQACIATVDMQINGPKIGSEYVGLVVTVKEYGAFVDIADGVSGLVHVSEIADERVSDVNQYLKEGDEVKVRVMEIDRFGKIKLSIKAIAPLPKKA
ncbi:MAG: polyribonucleotide nucleotidyltransferase [Bacteriovoracaceae bacterium]